MRPEWNLLTINLLADLNDRQEGWTIVENDDKRARVVFRAPDGVTVALSCADLEAYAYSHVVGKAELARRKQRRKVK